MTDDRAANSTGAASAVGSGRRPRLLGRLILGLALAIGVGIACLPWLLASPDRVSRLIAAAVPELRGDVRIGRVRLGWLGPIVAEDVTVVPRDGTESPVTVGRIEASNGLAAILFSAGDVGTLRVERPRVSIVFDAERKSNLEGLFAPPAAPETAGGRRPRRSPVRLALEVDDAIVQIAGPWTQEPWISDPIDVRASLRPSADGNASEWTIEPVRLLVDARMEPAVAQGVLAYIAPILADATRTSGRFSLRLDGGRIPVGDPASGTLAGELAMHEVVLGPGPLVASLVQSLPGRIPEPPAIKLADESLVKFRLEDRRVFHDGLRFGLPLARPGQRLDMHSRGSVGLDDRSLALQLSVPIPEGLPQDRPLLAALAGKTISLGIGGELGAPKVEFDGSIAATASDVVGELVERLRTGNAPEKSGSNPGPNQGLPPASLDATPTNVPPDTTVKRPTGGDATAAAVVDVVGDLLEEIARRRAERRAVEGANPNPQPPRRGGRLIRRLLVPPPGEAAPEGPSVQAPAAPPAPTPPPPAPAFE
jgi:hypothetical protein